jgi:hypothetical protein
MRKTITQDAFTRSLAAGQSLNLETPWLGGPIQGQMGAGGLQLSALLGAEIEASWRILSTDLNDIASLQATFSETRADLDGNEDFTAVSYDVTGQMLNGDGEVTAQCGPDPFVKFGLQVTNRSASAILLRVQRLITAEFSPHRSPADAQDAQGAGYGGTVAMPGVPVTYPIREQSRLAGHASELVDQPDGDDPMWSGELDA